MQKFLLDPRQCRDVLQTAEHHDLTAALKAAAGLEQDLGSLSLLLHSLLGPTSTAATFPVVTALIQRGQCPWQGRGSIPAVMGMLQCPGSLLGMGNLGCVSFLG